MKKLYLPKNDFPWIYMMPIPEKDFHGWPLNYDNEVALSRLKKGLHLSIQPIFSRTKRANHVLLPEVIFF